MSKHAKFYKLLEDQYVVFNNLIFESILLNTEEYQILKTSKFDLLTEESKKILIDKCILGAPQKDALAEK